MRTVLLVLLILILGGFSCKKEKIDISGITATDQVGNIMGSVDPTDWTHDANWSSEVESLFNAIGIVNLAGTTAGTISIFPAYPNPCTDQFRISIQSSTTCAIRLGLYDEQLNQKWSGTQLINVGNNTITISRDPARIGKGTYRLYYRFDSYDQQMFYKGHGDVMFF